MQSTLQMAKKIKRLRNGGKLRVLDLFAGCGGFSLGFQSAGFSIVGAIEIDPHAMASHSINFGRDNRVLDGTIKHALDIVQVNPDEFLHSLGVHSPSERAIDVLIGGPPCQAFARIGRAKLREIAKDPKAHQSDNRANLVDEYIRFVKHLFPLVLVVENVPDMMNQGGVNVVANVCHILSKLGYVCRYTLLNAAYFGVPQFRERVFIVGYHESLGIEPSFPVPTHSFDLPRGYLGSRNVAMKPISDGGKGCRWFIEPRTPSRTLPQAVSCADALSDLPRLVKHLSLGGMPKGARSLNNAIAYSKKKKISFYSHLMRQWPGFKTSGTVTAHVTRNLPRDYETFKRMRPNDQYPQAYDVAVQIYTEAVEDIEKKSSPVHASDLVSLWKSIVPPYDPNKFPNKWCKLDPRRPSKTLTAHIGKDTYSHIHYDSSQARTISVREAARLQSFPDGFEFAGAMNAAFRQIGNAVPPLLARAVAKQIQSQIRKRIVLKKGN